MIRISLLSLLLLGTVACGDDGGADALGVGAECTATDECDVETDQECLPDFKGGYCGIKNCTGDENCPEDSACVMHDDGATYCFRTCVDKAECNENRSVDNESNCSANVTFLEDQGASIKACVPPSA